MIARGKSTLKKRLGALALVPGGVCVREKIRVPFSPLDTG